jgi:hypothetical protein
MFIFVVLVICEKKVLKILNRKNLAIIINLVIRNCFRYIYSPVSSTNKTDRHDITEILLKIRVITKLPNSEQSYKGKVKTHNYINRQNQSTTGKL